MIEGKQNPINNADLLHLQGSVTASIWFLILYELRRQTSSGRSLCAASRRGIFVNQKEATVSREYTVECFQFFFQNYIYCRKLGSEMLLLLFFAVFSEIIEFCTPLVDIAHGLVRCSDGWSPGSVCSYFCETGYVMRGTSAILACNRETLRWNYESPVCVRKLSYFHA